MEILKQQKIKLGSTRIFDTAVGIILSTDFFILWAICLLAYLPQLLILLEISINKTSYSTALIIAYLVSQEFAMAITLTIFANILATKNNKQPVFLSTVFKTSLGGFLKALLFLVVPSLLFQGLFYLAITYFSFNNFWLFIGIRLLGFVIMLFFRLAVLVVILEKTGILGALRDICQLLTNKWWWALKTTILISFLAGIIEYIGNYFISYTFKNFTLFYILSMLFVSPIETTFYCVCIVLVYLHLRKDYGEIDYFD